ncbi:arabinose-5-phosphate isomerase [Verrucomicrobium sp. GAS474]|uniref:KpsF/GutQ family sugar-phosphate isomerase n=1 Tax=Verrucomicrobium sp. GAS474 TaxID=1882831 RepID=UPI00087CD9CF|nr:KpsF/GutQ family sugar-phosphate isomerase [Verrucomicrobium sp. GAS474]SDU01721.1 arabinose-5-phosphate isomerase [Verrucomicrobium sp. GAS474]
MDSVRARPAKAASAPKEISQARRVFDIEIDGLRRVQKKIGRSFPAAVALLASAVENGRKIVVCGVGKSGNIGQKITATLSSTGCPAVMLDLLNAIHGDLGVVSEGDVMIVLSYSGETEELVRVLPIFARMEVHIIAITGRPKSTLARNADVVLDVGVPKEACPLKLAPTTSSTAQLVLGDALAMVLLEKRGFKKEEFARYHPGGSLGKNLLLKVSEVMRPAESLAILPGTALVRDALRQWNVKRTGAAVIVGKKRQVVGIFTHGDFIRRYETDPNIGNARLADVMTANPITVHVGKLAAEVLNVFQKNRIDDLVVVDDTNRPVGLVDAQDVTKHRIV